MSNNYTLIYTSKVENPEITIAIPTYKRPNLLLEAISSAINQETSVKYDIIVVDNNPGRGDETEQLMEKFRDSLLVSYYKNSSNLGMVGNWNQLFSIAKGQWVAMLHDDDLLYPNYIKIMNERRFCLDNPSVIFPRYITSETRQLDRNISSYSSNNFKRLSVKSFIIGNIVGPPIGMFVNRDFFIKNLRFRSDFYPSIDWDFYIEASSLGNLYQISDLLCMYYIGVNESLKEDTILAFYKNARDFNQRLSVLLKFPYNFINKLCYRNLIVNTISWTAELTDPAVVNKAIASIGFKNNTILDYISLKIAHLFVRR